MTPMSFLLLPMYHLTFSSAVINSVASVACIEFVLWWIVWSVAFSTFNGFWNERGCRSSFEFVKHLKSIDGTLFSLLSRFHPPFSCSFQKGFLNTHPGPFQRDTSLDSTTNHHQSSSSFHCSSTMSMYTYKLHNFLIFLTFQ